MTEQEIQGRLAAIEGAQLAIASALAVAIKSARIINPQIATEFAQACERNRASLLASNATDASIHAFEEAAQMILEQLS